MGDESKGTGVEAVWKMKKHRIAPATRGVETEAFGFVGCGGHRWVASIGKWFSAPAERWTERRCSLWTGSLGQDRSWFRDRRVGQRGVAACGLVVSARSGKGREEVAVAIGGGRRGVAHRGPREPAKCGTGQTVVVSVTRQFDTAALVPVQ